MTGFTTRPVVQGRHGVVAAGHYLAAELGSRVLGEGGNAVDAGVAAVFALTLLKPQSAGIAGECPILIWRGGVEQSAGGGRLLPNPLAISGQGTAPRAATIDHFRRRGDSTIPGEGLRAATVPATVAACVTALRTAGRLGLRETLGPVVDLAEEGFAVYPALREQLAFHLDRYRGEWASTGEAYLDDGRVPEVGWRLRCRDWAAGMRGLLDAESRARSAGRDAGLAAALHVFYRGPIAQRIAAFAREGIVDSSGRREIGLLDRDDLAGYQARVEAPATVRFRGLDVFKCGPWTQGPVLLQQLRLLEGYDLASLGHNTAEYLHLLVEAAKLAFADREAFYGDPIYASVPLERLLSAEYAAARRALIDPFVASGDLRFGEGGRLPDRGEETGARLTGGDTTHVSVADAEGNLFSGTPSGGWLESSPVVPGLGFPLGSRLQVFNLDPGHPNGLAPGKRPRTTLTPSLAGRGGRPHMAFGTPGGDRQDQWLLQFFLNVVEFGMDLQEAIDAPLVHSEHFPSSFSPHAAFPRRLLIEGRVPEQVRDALAARGHDVQAIGDWVSGEVCAVRFGPDSGLVEGAASPRAMAAYAVGR